MAGLVDWSITHRGASFCASSAGDDIAVDPSIAGGAIVVPDPDFVPPPEAPFERRVLSVFLPASVLRAALAGAEASDLAADFCAIEGAS